MRIQKILRFKEFSRVENWFVKISLVKIGNGSLHFYNIFKMIYIDPFIYHLDNSDFMVLIDASIKLSHMCLLLAHNLAFVRFFAKIIRLRVYFLYYRIKIIHLDSVFEFIFWSFNDCCMSVRITIEKSVAQVHIQNDLAILFIECL